MTTLPSLLRSSALDELERLSHVLAPALTRGVRTHTLTDVAARVTDGSFQLWTAAHSILVTEVFQAPQVKVVRALWAGGRLDELTRLRDQVEAWARRLGCQEAWIEGRPGWERVHGDAGYARVAVTLVKDLRNGQQVD